MGDASEVWKAILEQQSPNWWLRLRCLELAIEQVRRENSSNFKEDVAILQTWLYNRIVNGDSPELSPTATDKLVRRRRRTLPDEAPEQ